MAVKIIQHVVSDREEDQAVADSFLSEFGANINMYSDIVDVYEAFIAGTIRSDAAIVVTTNSTSADNQIISILKESSEALPIFSIQSAQDKKTSSEEISPELQLRYLDIVYSIRSLIDDKNRH